MAKRTISELSVKAMVLVINETKAGLGPRKGRSSMKLMRLKAMTTVWMI